MSGMPAPWWLTPLLGTLPCPGGTPWWRAATGGSTGAPPSTAERLVAALVHDRARAAVPGVPPPRVRRRAERRRPGSSRTPATTSNEAAPRAARAPRPRAHGRCESRCTRSSSRAVRRDALDSPCGGAARRATRPTRRRRGAARRRARGTTPGAAAAARRRRRAVAAARVGDAGGGVVRLGLGLARGAGGLLERRRAARARRAQRRASASAEGEPPRAVRARARRVRPVVASCQRPCTMACVVVRKTVVPYNRTRINLDMSL